jgi:hypothetical protein
LRLFLSAAIELEAEAHQSRLFQNPVGADQRFDETTSWKKRSNARFFF